MSEPTPSPVDEPTPASLVRERVFARSYDEVLAALKHQDDKLNRTLTAIAFLTAAGVALFGRQASSTMHFPESDTSIPGFFFIVFLSAAALALTLALTAIGPSTSFRARRPGNGADGSLLFYASIASDSKWSRYVTDPPEAIVKHLVENFHEETKNIANRTRYKVVRSQESGAFVQLAILSLALLGVFSVETLSLSTRWWIASTILFLLLLAPFHDLLTMRVYGFTSDPIEWKSYVPLAISLVAAAYLLTRAPSVEQHWPAIWYALFVLVTSRLALAHQRRLSLALLAVAAAVGLVTVLFVEF